MEFYDLKYVDAIMQRIVTGGGRNEKNDTWYCDPGGYSSGGI